MQAARYGHESVVKHLLNKNAKSNVTTSLGLSALTLAIYGGYSKVRNAAIFKKSSTLDYS